MSARHTARKRSLSLLFEAQSRDLDILEVLQLRVQAPNIDEPVPKYAREIVSGIAQQIDIIDETIMENVTEGKRITILDRSVLRISIWELLNQPNMDQKVIIDEGVKLASEFSDDRSRAFVHAVLDSVAKQVKAGDIHV